MFVAMVVFAALSGCLSNNNSSAPNPEGKVQSPDVQPETSGVKGTAEIMDIVDNPNKYVGKTVTLVGKPREGLDQRTVYHISDPNSIRRDNSIPVTTGNYPKERLLCVKEMSVTGTITTRQDMSGKMVPVLTESSRKVLLVNQKWC